MLPEVSRKHSSHFWGGPESLALYLLTFLRSFALSLTGIFIPVFIFQYPHKPLIHPQPFISNILWVIVFYAVYALAATLSSLWCVNTVFTKLGFKRSILLGMGCLIAALGGLVWAEDYFLLIFLAALFLGASMHFYWLPFHIFFVRKANSGGNFGSESALRLLVDVLASVAGPIISALIITYVSYKAVFLMAAFILVIACVPIFMFVIEGPHRHHDVWRGLGEYWRTPAKRMFMLALFGSGAEDILYAIFWPILLYVVLKDVLHMGALTAFSLGISSLVMVWAGRVFEKGKAAKLFPISVFINATLYLVRMVANIPWLLYGIDVLDRFNGKVYTIGITTAIYDAAAAYGESDFLIVREIVAHSSRVVILCLIGALVALTGEWRFVFLVCTFASLTVLLLPRALSLQKSQK